MRTQLHHLIEERADALPAAPALTYKHATLSYGELAERVDQVAAGLGAAGVGRGDRVGVFIEKRLETVIAIFAASRAGAVFVPINPLLRGRQVAYILADCGVRLLVTSGPRADQLAEHVPQCPELEQLVLVDDAPTTAPVDVVRWSDLADAHTNAGTDTGAAARAGIDDDLAAILYTSGSTGNPKGVMLSHRNLIVGAESVSSYLGNHADDVILALLPLSFDAGFSQLTTAFSVGAHVVLHNYTLPNDVPKLCARHGVTGLTCVPPLWIQLATRTWPTEAAQLRYFANTGGRMPRPVLDDLRGHFPDARPFLMYGLTEAFRSTYLDPDEIDRRPDSIGRAIPNAEVLVLRADGSACDPGEQGELVHRGALVALGYWNDAERTAQRFRPIPGAARPGAHSEQVAVWSGDAVVADDDGFLYFVGRNDEMIKTSGYRVSPTEVEEAAYATSMVADVVALGVEDPDLGQRIVLVASPPDGAELDPSALLDALRRDVPAYMVPAEIVVRDELPRSPNGKFDRTRIRAEVTR